MQSVYSVHDLIGPDLRHSTSPLVGEVGAKRREGDLPRVSRYRSHPAAKRPRRDQSDADLRLMKQKSQG